MRNASQRWLVLALIVFIVLPTRLAIAHYLATDEPGDGIIYAQIARNVLEHHVYSHATEAPYDPSLIRLPGYPLFLAGVYSLFGHQNNHAVRLIQAFVDTFTCVLAGFIGFAWEPNVELKRKTALAAFCLTAVCPFTAIYVATILTETITTFLAMALTLLATLAFQATTSRGRIAFWLASGVVSGVAVLFRPDSGLFVAAVGLTLVITSLIRSSSASELLRQRIVSTTVFGFLLTIGFCVVLLPWTIRNWRVFHLFQPLAPAHAEMPGEFVPRGYLSWLRTWIDDERYIGPVLWNLDNLPINPDDIPDRAFDSAEEKQEVEALYEKYNHPPDEEAQLTAPASARDADIPPEDSFHPTEAESIAANDESASEEESDQEEETDETEEPAAEPGQDVEMTPVIDAAFARLASERIARHPLRFVFVLPIKRAGSLWFDTHSAYYPFEGELLPLEDLDYDIHQHVWLPLFVALTWIYSLMAVVGTWFLWCSRDFAARRWLLLAALIIILRVGFFSFLENPEPRYVVELFPFVAILAAIGVVHLIHTRHREASETA
jgi:4-amino-4-deoxy-L-arabinose transferase-like glycosyltransferase